MEAKLKSAARAPVQGRSSMRRRPLTLATEFSGLVMVAYALLTALAVVGCGRGIDPKSASPVSATSSASPSPAGATSGSTALADQSRITQFPTPERPWDRIPSITVAAAPEDTRIPLVLDAINFWNRQLEEIGTPFRLGAATHVTETVAEDSPRKLSDDRANQEAYFDAVRNMPGDIIVVLSDLDITSFGDFVRLDRTQVLIGIRDHRVLPLSLPNVARNVIAAELGRAIGLGHNDDRTKLMCGRPAECRPAHFVDTDRFFPLTDYEKAYLLKIYPATWQPTR